MGMDAYTIERQMYKYRYDHLCSDHALCQCYYRNARWQNLWDIGISRH